MESAPAPMPQPSNRRSNRFFLVIALIVGGLLLAMCACIVIFGSAVGITIFGATQPAATRTDEFLSALRDGQYERAFGYCAPELQGELDDAAGLRQNIESNDVVPESWNLTSRNLENNTATMAGSAKFKGGGDGEVTVNLRNVDGEWKVTGYHLR